MESWFHPLRWGNYFSYFLNLVHIWALTS
jgi:hypothetical protein